MHFKAFFNIQADDEIYLLLPYFNFFFPRGQKMEVVPVLLCLYAALIFFVMSHTTVQVNGSYESQGFKNL